MYHSDNSADIQPQWQTALRLHQDLKFSIAPVRPGKKWPDKWKHFQDPARRPTADTVRHWAEFHADWNYCIFCGTASGIVVVEADDDAADLAIRQRCRETPLVQVSGSDKRSRHYVYRYPSTLPDGWAKIPTRSKLLGLNLDIRGDGGLIVGPGSLRTDTGRRYQEVNPWTAERLAAAPEFDPAWLGLDTPRSPAKTTYQRTDVDLSEKQKAAQRWLERRKGAVQGDGADNYCYATAAAVQHDFDLTPDEAFPVMMEWGQRPDQLDAGGNWYPWDEAEIWHKLEDTDGLPNDDGKPRGWRLGDVQRAEFERQYTEKHRVQIEDIGPGLPDLKVSNQTELLRWTDIVRLAKSQRPRWVIADLVADGEISMFTSLPWGGKSTILAKAVADVGHSNDFFGYITNPTDILYVNADRNGYELFHGRIAPHVKDAEAMQRHLFTVPIESIPVPVTVNHLLAWIIEVKRLATTGHVWTIIDTTRTAFLVGMESGAEKDSTSMINMLTPLRKLALDTGTAITCLHHNSRHSDEYSGSAAIAGQVDTFVCIHREKGSTVAGIEIETRRSHRRKLVTVRQPDGTFATDKGGVTPDTLDIIQYFREAASEKDVAEWTGKDRSTIRRAIEEAEKAERLMIVQRHAGQMPAKWRLRG